MSNAEARKMITDLIGEQWLADVCEVDMGRKGTAYIAQLDRSMCLGSPTVVVEKAGKLRYPGVMEAKEIVLDAKKRNLLNPALYC